MEKEVVDNSLFIDIDSLGLLIKKLENNNEEVISKMDEINNKFIEIDTSVWNSPERKKYDDVFIPYIKSKAIEVKDSLEESNRKLSIARENYMKIEQKIN